MGDVKVTWNGSDIVDISASGSKSIKTGGKYNPYDMTLTYTRPSGGNEFIITVSDDGNGGWTIDKTFAEIYSAYTAGKDIIPWNGMGVLTYGEYDSENSQYNLSVGAYDSNADANKWWNYYTNANEPLTLNDVWYEYWTGDADAVAGNVASGKIFYTSTGRAVGSYTPPSPSLQTKSETPSLSAQEITADVGYDGLQKVNISAITSSLLANLDADFVAGNIKKDVDLFGLTGTYEGGGGDLKIFEKLAVDSFTCTNGNGVTVSHSLGVVPNFVMVSAKSPIMPTNGNRVMQSGVYSPMASMYISSTYMPAQFWTGYYRNNNGVLSTIQAGLYNTTYGFVNFSSTEVKVGRPTTNYQIGLGDYWLVTGVVKAAYCTSMPT